MDESKATKKDFINSLYALDVVKATQDHINFITYLYFKEKMATVKCQNVKKILSQFCMLFGLNQLHVNASACYQSGYFAGGPFNEYILEAIKLLLKELRPYALTVIESAEVPDYQLMSAIGNSYGDIYETHLEWAKNSRLNKNGGIPDGFMEYMMPILKHRAKL